MKLTAILNFTLSVICFFHVTSILNNYLNPETPCVKNYVKNLSEIEFPVTFKLCFEKENEEKMLHALGYTYIFDFYRGQSMYNESIYGWNGHTMNGTTLASVESRILFNFRKPQHFVDIKAEKIHKNHCLIRRINPKKVALKISSPTFWEGKY